MMNQRVTRVLAAILCLMLCIGAAGCAQQPAAADRTQTPAASDPAQSAAAAATDAPQQAEPEMEGNLYLTGLPIVKETTTYSVMVSKSTLDKTASFADKQILKDAQAQTNIAFDWMEVPASGWGDRVNIVFASGDLPDAIFGNVDVVANSRALMELTDGALAKYMPNVSAFLDENPLVKAKITAPDGKVYALPTGEDSSAWSILSDAYYINTQWLDQLNLEMPQTTQEFYDVLVAAKNAGDLNGNGAADEIPFGFAQVGGYPINSLFGAFGIINTAHYNNVEDGKVFFAPADARYYEALVWLNSLFNAGVMDLEGFAQTRAQYNGKSLAEDPVYFVLSAGTIGNTVASSQLENYQHILPLEGPNGDRLTRRSDASSTYNMRNVITVACEEPAGLMRWMDWCMSDVTMFLNWRQGAENVGWKWVDDAHTKWTRITDEVAPGYNSNDEYRFTEGFMGETAFVFAFSGIDRDISTDTMTLRKVETAQAYAPYFQQEIIYTDLLQSAEVQSQITLLFADIDTYIKYFVAESVTNGIDEAKWQEHLTQLEKLRIDEYVALYQDMYDRQPK